MNAQGQDQRKRQRVVVTGLGVVAPNAIGIPAFASALREGRSAFTSWRVEGIRRALPAALLDGFSFAPQDERAMRIGRRSALSVQVALTAALEANSSRNEKALGAGASAPGVIVAGQNLNQRVVFENAMRFAVTPEHLSPSYAMHHLDTDHVGAISELIGSHGSEGMTIGGASASGNVAIVQATRLIRDGYLKSCLVVGAMTDLSPMEISAFESLGALAGERWTEPSEACRPFDRDREGFVYGQSCAALFLESLEHAKERGASSASITGEILGGSIVLDGRRSTEPSADGEARAMRNALADADVRSQMVGYVNAHGTSSRIGDSTEIEAIAEVFGAEHMPRVWINSTKGLVGHGLSAAGVTEAVATLIQMRDGFVHPNKNLSNPLRTEVKFAPCESIAVPANELAISMSNSFGFGGFNSTIVLRRWNESGE